MVQCRTGGCGFDMLQTADTMRPPRVVVFQTACLKSSVCRAHSLLQAFLHSREYIGAYYSRASGDPAPVTRTEVPLLFRFQVKCLHFSQSIALRTLLCRASTVSWVVFPFSFSSRLIRTTAAEAPMKMANNGSSRLYHIISHRVHLVTRSWYAYFEMI